MAGSLGLTLYNLGQRAGATAPAEPPPPRPEGPLAWLHAPSAEALLPARALARRLRREAGAAVLLTVPPGIAAAEVEADAVSCPPPAEVPGVARAFLDHWRPAVAVLFEGELRPTLLHEAAERGIPVILTEARAPSLPRGRDGWWPGLMRSTLAGLRLVLAVDEPAARAFRKAGAIPGAVEAAGRMELPSAALPCNEAERTELSGLLHARPVWLAAGVPEAEEAAVIVAHRALLRLSHRLLLILVPEDPARIPAIARQMEDVEGWLVARRSADEIPEAETQVLLAEAQEYGLWFRLAPVTFIGGSLAGTGAAVDPLAPASLGSAVVHGPRAGVHGAVIGRLGAARGAALVGSAADLAETVSELLEPDRAARAAAAAWQVATEGSDLTARVVGLVRAAIEATEHPPRSAGPV